MLVMLFKKHLSTTFGKDNTILTIRGLSMKNFHFIEGDNLHGFLYCLEHLGESVNYCRSSPTLLRQSYRFNLLINAVESIWECYYRFD